MSSPDRQESNAVWLQMQRDVADIEKLRKRHHTLLRLGAVVLATGYLAAIFELTTSPSQHLHRHDSVRAIHAPNGLGPTNTPR